jgi:hypothetical protein
MLGRASSLFGTGRRFVPTAALSRGRSRDVSDPAARRGAASPPFKGRSHRLRRRNPVGSARERAIHSTRESRGLSP